MNKLLRAAVLMAAVCLLMSAGSALAAEKPLTISFKGAATLNPGQSASVLITKINAVQDGTVAFSLTDTVKKTVVYTETKTNVKAGQEIAWSVPYYADGITYSKPVKQMRASFVLDGKAYTYNLYYRYDQEGVIAVEKATWYPKNTACSFGPAFRDVRPALTEKWYTFTPVDLSRQGRQTFEYVASNLYVIGEVYVDVMGDRVIVSYHNFYSDNAECSTETLTEFFTFFHDLRSVTNVEPETMNDLGFRFGETISIEQDLEGDTHVLLFVRNQVTYCDYVTSQRKLTRFWPNLPERKALREQMMTMMEQ